MTYILIGIFGLLTGLIFGIAYEARYGQAEKDRVRYHKMLMRMIPHVQETCSNEYIYHDIIRNKE
jgi:hypothetical protein